jgi:chemotaxis protein MotA
MDLGTILGFIVFGILVGGGVYLGELSSSLINAHAVLVVMGGSLSAMLFNTPLKYMWKAVTEIRYVMFTDESGTLKKVIPVIVALADQCRSRGLIALKDADPKVAEGFLFRVASAAMEYNDTNFVKQVITQEINQFADEMNEIANVYRTFGLLSPMFGLLGTLIGIISVLKQLSDPESVGPAMAVAISSAFYGILFANMVCVPIAGKIRSRIWLNVKLYSMILDGVLEIMKGSLPLVIERRLQSYLGEKQWLVTK